MWKLLLERWFTHRIQITKESTIPSHLDDSIIPSHNDTETVQTRWLLRHVATLSQGKLRPNGVSPCVIEICVSRIKHFSVPLWIGYRNIGASRRDELPRSLFSFAIVIYHPCSNGTSVLLDENSSRHRSNLKCAEPEDFSVHWGDAQLRSDHATRHHRLGCRRIRGVICHDTFQTSFWLIYVIFEGILELLCCRKDDTLDSSICHLKLQVVPDSVMSDSNGLRIMTNPVLFLRGYTECRNQPFPISHRIKSQRSQHPFNPGLKLAPVGNKRSHYSQNFTFLGVLGRGCNAVGNESLSIMVSSLVSRDNEEKCPQIRNRK